MTTRLSRLAAGDGRAWPLLPAAVADCGACGASSRTDVVISPPGGQVRLVIILGPGCTGRPDPGLVRSAGTRHASPTMTFCPPAGQPSRTRARTTLPRGGDRATGQHRARR